MVLFCKNEATPLAHSRNAPGVLLAFVVLSTIAHGVTFLFSSAANPPSADPHFGAIVISTILSPVKGNMPEHPSPNIPHVKTPRKTETIATTQQATGQHIVASNQATSLQLAPTAPTKPATPPVRESGASTKQELASTLNSPDSRQKTQHNAQRNYLLGEVQNRLSRYLTYPRNARRRGWQGEVMVAFHITDLGILNNVRLAKSSGYSLLDRSAIAAINKLGNIALPEKMKPLQAMDLLLPVSYQLREG